MEKERFVSRDVYSYFYEFLILMNFMYIYI